MNRRHVLNYCTTLYVNIWYLLIPSSASRMSLQEAAWVDSSAADSDVPNRELSPGR